MVKVYNKLVRDGIIGIIEQNGGIPKYRILSDSEMEIALLEKLVEETIELKEATTDEERKKETADVLEVFDTILNVFGYDLEDIKTIGEEKCLKRGGFDKKIYLESVEEQE